MTSTTRDGTLVTIDGRPALRFERRYPHPIERVWRAISDPDEMAHWFPSEVVGERRVGADLVFDDEAQRAAAREAGEPHRTDEPFPGGRVVAFDPPHVFSFTWGGELLRIELTPDGDGTRLLFTQVLSHPSVAARNGAGWHSCLTDLDGFLGAAQESSQHWSEVYADYIRRMGPPLGTPAGDGAVTWERMTHVDADRVRAATTDAAELSAWGAGDDDRKSLRWDLEPADVGTVYRLTHTGVGSDAALASRWHALLIQLDMYLAAGQLVPADSGQWVDDYERVLPD
jgi:uncharacterized protein YndB with AHSA1/START domain